jgi:hypothetical protein
MRQWWLVSICVLACGAGTNPECKVTNAFALEPGEKTGPEMRPGNNCLRCHVATGEAKEKPFSFGGTVFAKPDDTLCGGVAGVTVKVTDSKGKVVEVVTNSVGNFWSAETLEQPLSIEASYQGRVRKMPVTTPTGGCALCHSWPDKTGGAQGRIVAP